MEGLPGSDWPVDMSVWGLSCTLIDGGGFSPLWAEPFPRQGFLGCIRKVTECEPT